MKDPYQRCEHDPENDIRGVCRHDLGRGVLVSDLLSDNGPHDDPVAKALLERLLNDYCPD